MKLCGFLITYNEEKKGNIRRCLDNLTKVCDEVAVYDDASTDGTVDVCREYTKHVIEGKKNIGFPNKPQKNILIRYVTEKIKPDWVVWLDADEMFDRSGTDGEVRKLCKVGEDEGIDGFEIHEVNLYLSDAWRRTDRLYDAGWFCRLWRNDGNLRFQEEKVLHPVPFPVGLSNIQRVYSTQVLHYGFSSLDKIVDKFKTYRMHGQAGELLERLVPVGHMVLERVDDGAFPKGNIPMDNARPTPPTRVEWARMVA